MIVALVVRDEAPTLAATLATLRACLPPKAKFLIHDTGSVDDTPAIAQREVEGRGAVFRVPWPDSYSDAYNAALARAETLVSNPDEWIFHAYARRTYHGEWKSLPVGAVFSVERYSPTLQAARVCAYRAKLHCRYEGRTHERLVAPRDEADDCGVWLERMAAEHPRPDRFERDLRLLEGDPSPRAAFYRAQTLACLGRLPEAHDAYLERAHRDDGALEERYVALFRLIQMYPRAPENAPHAVVVRGFAALAGRLCPARVEHHVALAEWYAAVGRPDLAALRAGLVDRLSPVGSLFRDPSSLARARALQALA